MDILGYAAMLLVGAMLGLVGGGGAILTVPILVYLFKTSALLATSYSLFIVGTTSLFGVWRYHQEKLVDYGTALNFALPSFVGTYLARQVLMPRLPDVVVQIGERAFTKDQLILSVFAVVMLAASVSMIRGGAIANIENVKRSRSLLMLALLGVSVGFVAGFVGAGGGFLIIPALVVVAGMPMANAVGTSLLIISANSLFGFAGDSLGATAMNWEFLASTTLIALVGIFLGSYAARFVPASKLKPMFGWFVLLMAGFILFSQWHV